MTGTNLYIQRLLEANPLREPVLRSAIQALQLLRASHGLDVGCGIGLQALLLAEAVGADGHVRCCQTIGKRINVCANPSRRISFSTFRTTMRSLLIPCF